MWHTPTIFTPDWLVTDSRVWSIPDGRVGICVLALTSLEKLQVKAMKYIDNLKYVRQGDNILYDVYNK